MAMRNEDLRDYVSKAVRERLTRMTDNAFGVTSTVNNADANSSFTFADLQEAQRLLDKKFPVPHVDLWPHDLPENAMYELKTEATDVLSMWITDGRRQLIVPRTKLLEIFHMMKDAGIDVRLQPVKRPSSKTESVDEPDS